MTKEIVVRKGESWWGAASDKGIAMPFPDGFACDMRGENFGNQAAPLLLSNTGRYVWSEHPFAFRFHGSGLVLTGKGPFIIGGGGKTLRDAFRTASRRFFPPSGRTMDPRLFTAPQYNTWIELMYDQEQEAILRYARALIKEGYPPGVLMIDEGWANYYGDWDFHPVRFPDPRGMISELHRLGFQVMLWIVPFVVPDSAVFRELRHTGVFLRDAAGKVAVREWWNGHSAVVDATGEEGARWLRKMLDALRRKYGIDGFKFDGGDISSYRDDDRAAAPASANAQAEAYGRLGTRYRLNEYRAAWKCGGLPLTQRLRDKNHSWGPDGLGSLVPNTLAQGLLGHPFVCPDMIGGGEYLNFRAQSSHLDSELFVRYAQASALMPMMQFSAAPWRVLDRRHAVLCLEAAHLHLRFGKQILAEARRSARSGEPMARSMEYQFSGAGYEHVSDQFLLGGRLLVAPVLKKGAKRRAIEIPPGTWIDDRGESFRGPIRIETDTPLERLPYFVRLSIR